MLYKYEWTLINLQFEHDANDTCMNGIEKQLASTVDIRIIEFLLYCLYILMSIQVIQLLYF